MKEITAALLGARRIALVSHRDPDPDTIGSALALGLGLESIGKKVSWHCADPVPEQQRFLHGSDRFTQMPPTEDVDLVVTVDFGSVDRAKFTLPARPTLERQLRHSQPGRRHRGGER
jgi:phosphoesterase RecJ-like protein